MYVDLDKEMIVEAVEALIDVKESEMDRKNPDSYEHAKLEDDLHILKRWGRQADG